MMTIGRGCFGRGGFAALIASSAETDELTEFGMGIASPAAGTSAGHCDFRISFPESLAQSHARQYARATKPRGLPRVSWRTLRLCRGIRWSVAHRVGARLQHLANGFHGSNRCLT